MKVTYNRDKYLQRTYGITLKQYNTMLRKQRYKCAICGKKSKDSKIAFDVDHDHLRGIIRGLLCRYCNSRVLKYLHDNVVIGKGLVKYLSNWIKEVENG